MKLSLEVTKHKRYNYSIKRNKDNASRLELTMVLCSIRFLRDHDVRSYVILWGTVVLSALSSISGNMNIIILKIVLEFVIIISDKFIHMVLHDKLSFAKVFLISRYVVSVSKIRFKKERSYLISHVNVCRLVRLPNTIPKQKMSNRYIRKICKHS